MAVYGGITLTRAQLPKLLFITNRDDTITYGVCTTIKQNDWNEIHAIFNHVDTKGLGEIALTATQLSRPPPHGQFKQVNLAAKQGS
jgi:hypothetical protein